MTIKILGFGIVREIFGCREISLEIGEQTTVEELKNQLTMLYPQLAKLRFFMIAQNNKYAKPEDLIEKDSEIAIIPPVSGG